MLLPVATAATLIVLVVAGCSTRDVGHPTPTADAPVAGPSNSATVATQASTDPGRCGVYRTGSNARVFLSASDNGECATLAQQLSADGSFWTVRDRPLSNDQVALVCAMQQSGNRAEIEDTGSQMYGRQVQHVPRPRLE